MIKYYQATDDVNVFFRIDENGKSESLVTDGLNKWMSTYVLTPENVDHYLSTGVVKELVSAPDYLCHDN